MLLHFIGWWLCCNISKRSRPDLAPAVPFLTTRVTKPTEDDWKKLRNVIEYLSQTKDLPLVLEVDRSKPDVWSVDAAYAVHADCKSHTGASYTMGKGSFISFSFKQKTMTKSSCEAELVAVDDVIGHILRIRHFLLAQGYKPAEKVIILQDNRSVILLEQNGIMNSTKRTKHINVKYYFVKDKIDSGEVEVVWYSGDKMVGDFFSKPLSGQKFLRFRLKIMNNKKYLATNKTEVNEPDSKSKSSSGLAMVVINGKRTMQPGYWKKQPGKKAVFVCAAAREPRRKGPTRIKGSKDPIKGSKNPEDSGNKPTKNKAKHKKEYDLDDLFADMRNMPVDKDSKDGTIPGRPRRFRPGMKPGPPYRCMVRSDITDWFIKESEDWESVVNRKTYDSLTGKLIEDLDLYPDILCGNSGEMKHNHDVHPTIPDEVLTRRLPKGVDHIKTVFEYGVLTYPKRSNKKN